MSLAFNPKKAYTLYISETCIPVRSVSTLQHAVKHAAFCAELQIPIQVQDNRLFSLVLDLPAIDDNHAIRRPKTKRDKRYAKIARRAMKQFKQAA